MCMAVTLPYKYFSVWEKNPLLYPKCAMFFSDSSRMEFGLAAQL